MNKKYKLQWTTNAKNDLLDIIQYIKKDSSSNAKNIYKKIREKAKSSSFFPMKGRVVPELQKEGITLYREVIVSPWRIIYQVDIKTVYIMAIIDSRQNVEEVLLKKIIKINTNKSGRL
jgi:addiction module RelE/StbE family toxin